MVRSVAPAIDSPYPEGLRPSDSPTRSLARRFAGALPPPLKLRRDLAEALRAKAGRSRGSLAAARSRTPVSRVAVCEIRAGLGLLHDVHLQTPLQDARLPDCRLK